MSNAEFWTAIATTALAIVAFASFWIQLGFSVKQIREARKASMDLLATQRNISKNEIGLSFYWQFTDRWDSRSMHLKRGFLARRLSEARETKKINDAEIKEDVMNFFEEPRRFI